MSRAEGRAQLCWRRNWTAPGPVRADGLARLGRGWGKASGVPAEGPIGARRLGRPGRSGLTGSAGAEEAGQTWSRASSAG